MAKSNDRLDRELRAVASEINAERDFGKVSESPEMRIAFAIYRTLRWARGHHEMPPIVEAHRQLRHLRERAGKEDQPR